MTEKKWAFPIDGNRIFKPKVPHAGEWVEVGKETDAYGYGYTRWSVTPPITFTHGGRVVTVSEAITYPRREG